MEGDGVVLYGGYLGVWDYLLRARAFSRWKLDCKGLVSVQIAAVVGDRVMLRQGLRQKFGGEIE
jgi:hypothetical protein